MHSDTTSPAMAKRQRRAGRIRRSAVGSALATFAVVWAAIFFQLVSGHDPALSKPHAQAQPAAAVQQATPESATEPETESDDGSVPDTTTTTPTTPPATSEPLGSVTTRQS